MLNHKQTQKTLLKDFDSGNRQKINYKPNEDILEVEFSRDKSRNNMETVMQKGDSRDFNASEGFFRST